MQVRTARHEDEPVLQAIDQVTWTTAASPGGTPAPGTPFFGDRSAPDDVLVAEVENEVAGYVALRAPTSLPSNAHVLVLVGLAVAPAHQRRGVAEELVRAAVAEARRRGARKLSLRVLAGNAGARRLYERLGFVVEGVLREEFLLDGAFVDDVLMALDLTSD